MHTRYCTSLSRHQPGRHRLGHLPAMGYKNTSTFPLSLALFLKHHAMLFGKLHFSDFPLLISNLHSLALLFSSYYFRTTCYGIPCIRHWRINRMANSSAVCLAMMQAAYDIVIDDYELTLVPVRLLLCLDSRENGKAYDQQNKLE